MVDIVVLLTVSFIVAVSTFIAGYYLGGSSKVNSKIIQILTVVMVSSITLMIVTAITFIIVPIRYGEGRIIEKGNIVSVGATHIMIRDDDNNYDSIYYKYIKYNNEIPDGRYERVRFNIGLYYRDCYFISK